jgi:nicotinamidase-related amidase
MGQAPPLPSDLRFGPLGPGTVHLCIDMQVLFADRTPWHTPWMNRVLPIVTRIAEAHPGQTVFTRFLPPHRPDELPGSWRRYYTRWAELTLDRIDPGWLELVPPLRRLAPPAMVVDKQRYSPFAEPNLPSLLRQRGADSLVVTGAETDVCVLAAVLDAVDLGYRVVLARDAICSSSDRTHDALMTLYGQRFSEQIETADTDAILAAWPTL